MIDALTQPGAPARDGRERVPPGIKIVRSDRDVKTRARAIFALSRIDANEIATMHALSKSARVERPFAGSQHHRNLPSTGVNQRSYLGRAYTIGRFPGRSCAGSAARRAQTKSAADHAALRCRAFAREADQVRIQCRNPFSPTNRSCFTESIVAFCCSLAPGWSIRFKTTSAKSGSGGLHASLKWPRPAHYKITSVGRKNCQFAHSFLQHDDRDTATPVAIAATKTSLAPRGSWFDRDEMVGFFACRCKVDEAFPSSTKLMLSPGSIALP